MIKYKTVSGNLTYIHEFDEAMEKATAKFEEEGSKVANQNFTMSGIMIACVFEYFDAEQIKKFEEDAKAAEEARMEQVHAQIKAAQDAANVSAGMEGVPIAQIDDTVVPMTKKVTKKASGKSRKTATDKA